MSENILKELCNRVLNLFKQTETKEENAKDVACNRLRVVLMQDRTNLTPELLQRMRSELIELLSKYVEMDKDALELNLDQEDGQMALMLSIPVIRAKDEEEIEKALAAEKQSKQESEDSTDDEENDSEEGEEEEETSEENTEETEEEIEITEESEEEQHQEENFENSNNENQEYNG